MSPAEIRELKASQRQRNAEAAFHALPRLLEERERLLEALRGLLAWAESPATKAVESCAWVHGVKYTAEDVAAWDTARTQRAFAEAPAK